jgi:hypothetical protein
MDPIIKFGVDLALLILFVEGLLLAIYRLRTGRGMPVSSVLLVTIAGIGLLFALRAAVVGAAGHWIAIGLIIGGIAHGIDLFRRFRNQS